MNNQSSIINNQSFAPPILTKNALRVLWNRYLIKDDKGRCIETPAQLFSRVASLVAKAESKYGSTAAQVKEWHKRYYDLMASLQFLPNSPALMNAQRSGMLSACFVLPIEDSIEGIFEAIKQTALIQKAGGGTTSGPISFWRVFSETTNAIQQGAFRRGANMGMMSVEHPDILKFLYAKQNLAAFTNFNISVKVADKWMKNALKSGKDLHVVRNPRTQERYLLPRRIDIAGYTIKDLHKLSGREKLPSGLAGRFYTVGDIWKMIVRCAHKTGEPGVAFINRINKNNPTPSLGLIEATNPCGEQPLLPFEACTLGSINLTKFVTFAGGRARMDWSSLAQAVKLSVRFLDNIIDVCSYPVEKTKQLAQTNRKIGLGVMGFADCLFLLGISYDSSQGVKFGSQVMKFINDAAHKASSELAELRGTFPNYENSIWQKKKIRIRNAAITCIAPTGTISIIADCSAGVEPLYSLVFLRQVLETEKMMQINTIFKREAQTGGFYNKKLVERIARAGSIQKMTQIPAKVRRVFKCAYDIKPEWHIRMQAAFQKHCDAAVSKTINFPKKAKVADIDKAYRLAYRLGCKGITVYRQHSRAHEPMTLD